eukprot:scaffold67679_cov43-Prasinocladus_malaysianus.AAC.1
MTTMNGMMKDCQLFNKDDGRHHSCSLPIKPFFFLTDGLRMGSPASNKNYTHLRVGLSGPDRTDIPLGLSCNAMR